MGMRHDGYEERRYRGPGLIQILAVSLAIAAIVKELRTAPERRTWNGVVAGFVPYDFRVPTLERIKSRIWDPDSEHVINPEVFGVGWTLNLGRIVALAKSSLAEAS